MRILCETLDGYGFSHPGDTRAAPILYYEHAQPDRVDRQVRNLPSQEWESRTMIDCACIVAETSVRATACWRSRQRIRPHGLFFNGNSAVSSKQIPLALGNVLRLLTFCHFEVRISFLYTEAEALALIVAVFVRWRS